IPACTFLDVEGHWAQPHICEALRIGIVEGHSATSFQPQAYITRVEFAAMLLRALGISAEPAGSGLSFSDQDQIPGWAVDAVSTAVARGIVQGYPDDTIRPTHRINRSEMVAMTASAMKWRAEP